MKIGILTSSRADYGVYLPLLDDLKKDHFFDMQIIAFGTHLSEKHGFTLKNIIRDEYKIIHKIDTFINDDSKKGIVDSYAKTINEFSRFWNNNNFDLVFCLGDRFEMSAAVQSSIPFGITLAHIAGGETTLGAIDNIYRHQISLASKIHFVSTKCNLKKVIQITGCSNYVYNVGSLSLSKIKRFKAIDKSIFFKKFGIKNDPYILVTFHPETVSLDSNLLYVKEISKALSEICREINVIITMPNADTLGSIYRKEINDLRDNNKNSIFLIENFGKKYYFNAMHYSTLLLGNTSSGIIEAASFGKYVINVGDRQKGRTQSLNVHDVNFNSNNIIKTTLKLLSYDPYSGENIYFKTNPEKKIIKILKNNFHL